MAPEILLCDEPFSGLDPPNVSRIEALIVRLSQSLGLTVIVSSHHMASSLRNELENLRFEKDAAVQRAVQSSADEIQQLKNTIASLRSGMENK